MYQRTHDVGGGAFDVTAGRDEDAMDVVEVRSVLLVTVGEALPVLVEIGVWLIEVSGFDVLGPLGEDAEDDEDATEVDESDESYELGLSEQFANTSAHKYLPMSWS
jgi:hypothetical protein